MEACERQAVRGGEGKKQQEVGMGRAGKGKGVKRRKEGELRGCEEIV